MVHHFQSVVIDHLHGKRVVTIPYAWVHSLSLNLYPNSSRVFGKGGVAGLLDSST